MDAAVILFIATFTGNEWTFPIANRQNDRFVDHNVIVANEDCKYHFLIPFTQSDPVSQAKASGREH